MPSFKDLTTTEYNNPGEFFLDFHEWFQNLPIANQILMFVLLVLMTVGFFIFMYYILKGILYLVYYALKGTYLLLKAIFFDLPCYILGINKKSKNKNQRLTKSERKKYRYSHSPKSSKFGISYHSDATIKPPQTIVTSKIGQKKRYFKNPDSAIIPKNEPKSIHCPMCGCKFTFEMNRLLTKNRKVFCEYCGHGLEYITQ